MFPIYCDKRLLVMGQRKMTTFQLPEFTPRDTDADRDGKSTKDFVG